MLKIISVYRNNILLKLLVYREAMYFFKLLVYDEAIFC